MSNMACTGSGLLATRAHRAFGEIPSVYILHIGNKNYSSWSLRPWLLMRARDIAFEERLTPFDDVDNWARFRAFSPSGEVPCLVDGDTVVWDSLAIAEYLAEHHVGVWPSDAAARTWARCAAAEMHAGFPVLRQVCTMNCGIRVALDAVPAKLSRELQRLDELLSQGLSRFDGPWLAGSDFSAVDAFYGPVAFRWQTYGFEVSAPLADYFRRLLALPAAANWYQAALREPWRDAAHEAEVKDVGRVLQDLRVGSRAALMSAAACRAGVAAQGWMSAKDSTRS